jgi:hypothetical protein
MCLSRASKAQSRREPGRTIFDFTATFTFNAADYRQMAAEEPVAKPHTGGESWHVVALLSIAASLPCSYGSDILIFFPGGPHDTLRLRHVRATISGKHCVTQQHPASPRASFSLTRESASIVVECQLWTVMSQGRRSGSHALLPLVDNSVEFRISSLYLLPR